MAAKAKKAAAPSKARATNKMPLHGDASWFVHDRFGMFIHWGTYALPARHEWVKTNEAIPDETYQTYFDHFDPDLYDPTAWARAAKAAGMKYFVITTKHHEGFCLWDTKHTDYKAPNTPCGRDLLRPMVEAFRAEGLKVGFYYSLLDWHHPEFPVDCLHPMRKDTAYQEQHKGRDVRKYAKYMFNQVTELLTEFGKIDYLFFDFSYPGEDGKGRDDWNSLELMRLCRTLQPHILINNRLDLMDVPGGWDFMTPEQYMSPEWPTVDGKRVMWETCQTFSGSWGYHRDEQSWKSVQQLLYLLIDSVSKGGNVLLNVGPTARGTFDARALDRLAGLGEWTRLNGRSIYGCTEAPKEFVTPTDTRLTYNPETRRLYVHFLNWPIHTILLPGLAGKVKYGQFLHDASEVVLREEKREINQGLDDKRPPGSLVLTLPVTKPDVEIPVVELYLV